MYVLLDIGNGRLEQRMCEPTQSPEWPAPRRSLARRCPSGCGWRLLRYAAPFQRSSGHLRAGPIAVLVKKDLYVP